LDVIPIVVNADLSSYYYLEDEAPSPEERISVKEMVYQSLRELEERKRKIILLLMCGYEAKNVANYLCTNEMAITRAKRTFWARLVENGYG
jgi:DNA-directed RNA polymerase specialized sigma subunit